MTQDCRHFIKGVMKDNVVPPSTSLRTPPTWTRDSSNRLSCTPMMVGKADPLKDQNCIQIRQLAVRKTSSEDQQLLDCWRQPHCYLPRGNQNWTAVCLLSPVGFAVVYVLVWESKILATIHMSNKNNLGMVPYSKRKQTTFEQERQVLFGSKPINCVSFEIWRTFNQRVADFISVAW